MSRFGSIGDQFFDDSGKPLSSGLLHFYESGTNTAKTTYSDADQSIANANPVVLDAAGRPPNIFFNGSARCVSADSADVQVEVYDPVGSSTSKDAYAPYNALITYDAGDIAQGIDDAYYQSIAGANLGNEPSASPTLWTETRFIKVWNAYETFIQGAMVIVGGGAFYRCINGGSLNDPPASTPAEWATIGGSGMNDILEDTSPQLGGALDVNGNALVTLSNADLDITPHGTGETNVTRLTAVGTVTLPGTWTIVLDGTHLDFKYGGTTQFTMQSDGEFIANTELTVGTP